MTVWTEITNQAINGEFGGFNLNAGHPQAGDVLVGYARATSGGFSPWFDNGEWVGDTAIQWATTNSGTEMAFAKVATGSEDWSGATGFLAHMFVVVDGYYSVLRRADGRVVGSIAPASDNGGWRSAQNFGPSLSLNDTIVSANAARLYSMYGENLGGTGPFSWADGSGWQSAFHDFNTWESAGRSYESASHAVGGVTVATATGDGGILTIRARAWDVSLIHINTYTPLKPSAITRKVTSRELPYTITASMEGAEVLD